MQNRQLIAGLLVLAGLSGCTEPKPPEFRVGMIVLGSGPLVPMLAAPSRNGARIAVDELNAAGGVTIGGVKHRVVLVERLTEARPDAAASAAAALVNLDSADVVIVPLISAQSAAAAAVAEAAGVPMIAPMASNPAVTGGRKLVFRLAFTDAFQGELLATFAYDTLGMRRVAALADPASSYAQDIVRLFSRTFEARGGRIVAHEGFAADGSKDFRPQLRKIIAARAEAILLPNYMVQDSIQVRQARELGFKGRFFGSDSWDPAAIVNLPAARGGIVVANWDPRTDREASRAFVATYQQIHGAAPRTAAAATYDAVILFARAAEKAGSRDGIAVADAIRDFGSFTGASADFRWRGSNDPVRGGVLIEVLAGRDSIRLVSAPEP